MTHSPSSEQITRDYEIIWNDSVSNAIKRAYYNGTLPDIVEEAKKKAIEIGGTTPVNIVERKHVANVSLGTCVEFKS